MGGWLSIVRGRGLWVIAEFLPQAASRLRFDMGDGEVGGEEG